MTDEKEIQIIGKALELFLKYGIKSLTMDDVARHLHISKKTLYQFVSDKKDLVVKSVQLAISEEQNRICCSVKESNTAIDELIEITKCINSKTSEIHPSVLYDLQKYHPKAWELMMDHKKEFIHGIMSSNLNRGIKEGYYRKKMNPEIVASIYMIMVDQAMNAESHLAKKLSIDKLHLEVINYHFNGICNQKGLDYAKEVIKKQQNDLLSLD